MSKKALIVYGGWPGHNPKETSELIEQDLIKSGFSVEKSETLDAFLDEAKLETFDLIVVNWTMGEIKGEQEKALLKAVENGVGVGGIHGGLGDAFRINTTFQFMVGGQFVAHPDNQKDYVVNIVKKDDPIVAGLKDFKVNSEQYYLHVDPSNEVIASTVFETTSAPWVNGTVMPVAWKRNYGKGRVFYQSVGHAVKDLEVPEVREMTRRGLVWAAR